MNIFIRISIPLIIYLFAFLVHAEPSNIDALKHEIIEYVDAGTYNKEITEVIKQAKNAIDHAVLVNQKLREPKKLAIVLDIDETVLSNYKDILKHHFVLSHKQWMKDHTNYYALALIPTLKLYQDAIKKHVSVFFVTGRRLNEKPFTISHLKKLGYTDWNQIYFKPNDYNQASAAPYKTSTRIDIEKQGYTIIANIGDQNSDLIGGHAEHTYKLPNPFYLIP